ncbi:MAG: PilZ domain-containing protein [Lachnospiraceae bacterium]|nr:PilZ domain-containing protein [Lachnospiraceae bacterium]
MYLWEIPKQDNIIIHFDLGGKHFGFTTKLLPGDASMEHAVYTEPVLISGTILRINKQCKNLAVSYFSTASGRTHYWDQDLTIEFDKAGHEKYVIRSKQDSIPQNRRMAIRVTINAPSECTISLLEGKYPCTVMNVSVTGIGINVAGGLTERQLSHHIIVTYFTDDMTRERFIVKARILHVNPVNATVMRCGCEIIDVTPPINEFINLRQMNRLSKSSRIESPGIPNQPQQPDKAVIPEANELIPEPPDEKSIDLTGVELKEDAECPACHKGRLYRSMGCYICDDCGIMLHKPKT